MTPTHIFYHITQLCYLGLLFFFIEYKIYSFYIQFSRTKKDETLEYGFV